MTKRGRAVRLTADPQEVGRGLGQVVVVLLELLRDLLERQAVRRVDSGTLPPAQVEELGQALIEVRDAIAQVRDSLGVSAEQTRAATARARELVGDWPPADLAADVEPASGASRGAAAGGGGERRSNHAGGHGTRRRPSGTPAIGRLLEAGRWRHEQGRPAAGVRGPAPPG
ncbi:gas vesicle protein GvpK [Pseudofrankia inefficax]|uniref:Gas vesicle K n=1 Tax=Pseudofrankia inefficax (strain DSM 45817 / CECT 9037 / DDB 130130 / EuI1c) TaxID=298654 RepID=E3J8E9_PSEI1|nr:gas vesicle protein GvpK [Pseudofrankia inefficax]ADP84483.1 Gas vesicle K [Pseudofrankia inefficax]